MLSYINAFAYLNGYVMVFLQAGSNCINETQLITSDSAHNHAHSVQMIF